MSIAMTIKKDKQKVLGEFFDEERIRTFLDFEAPYHQQASYHLLEKAYRGMIAENFDTFVRLFIEAGHDINAKNNQSETFLTTIKQHKQADDYIVTLESAGAL